MPVPRRVALFNDTTNDLHYGCDIVVAEIERQLDLRGIEIVWRHSVEQDWRTDSQIVAGQLDVDLVLVNGEGTLHDTKTWSRATILSEVGPYARDKLNVPAYLINAGIHAIDKPAAYNIQAFTRVYVRDTYSQKELAVFGIASSVVPDLTVCRPYAVAQKRHGILATDSVIDDVAARIGRRAKLEAWPYEPIKYGVPPPRGRTGAENFAMLLSSFSLVVTGRFHVATLCLATGTPVVAVESRTPKIGGLLQDALGSRRRVITPSEIDTFNPSEFIIWTDKEAERLAAFQRSAQDRAAVMFQQVLKSKICDRR